MTSPAAAAAQDRPRRSRYTQLWFWVVIAIPDDAARADAEEQIGEAGGAEEGGLVGFITDNLLPGSFVADRERERVVAEFEVLGRIVFGVIRIVMRAVPLGAFGGTFFSAESIAVGIALVVGIDRIMSEGRALTNCIGNGVATTVIAGWQGSATTSGSSGRCATRRSSRRPPNARFAARTARTTTSASAAASSATASATSLSWCCQAADARGSHEVP